MKIFDTIGTKAEANLLADPRGADMIAVNLEPGNGALKAGTILYRKSSGLYAPATTSQLSTSYYLAILAADVETGGTHDAIAEDAAAYRQGRFIDGAVILKSGDALNASYKLALRLEGIVMTPDADTALTVDNTVYTITYKANTTAAQPDYIVTEVAGATHTVLANTVTGFTAPEGKEFDEWNPKADGSGTGVDPAATFTVEADVTLYATWKNAG